MGRTHVGLEVQRDEARRRDGQTHVERRRPGSESTVVVGHVVVDTQVAHGAADARSDGERVAHQQVAGDATAKAVALVAEAVHVAGATEGQPTAAERLATGLDPQATTTHHGGQVPQVLVGTLGPVRLHQTTAQGDGEVRTALELFVRVGDVAETNVDAIEATVLLAIAGAQLVELAVLTDAVVDPVGVPLVDIVLQSREVRDELRVVLAARVGATIVVLLHVQLEGLGQLVDAGLEGRHATRRLASLGSVFEGADALLEDIDLGHRTTARKGVVGGEGQDHHGQAADATEGGDATHRYSSGLATLAGRQRVLLSIGATPTSSHSVTPPRRSQGGVLPETRSLSG